MTDKFELKNTGMVQVDSLVAFMDSIGYKPCPKVNGRFITDSPLLKSISSVSLSTAVRIHNSPRSQWRRTAQDGIYKLEIGDIEIYMNAYALNVAFARKLVHTVKLQKNRKSPDGVKVTSHMLKFVDPTYAKLLGLE